VEILKALLHIGLCKEEDLESLVVNVEISDGIRSPRAESLRYFIHKGNTPLCSVKEINKNSVFELESIINTQKEFNGFEGISSPEIYGIYETGEHLYIIEELISEITTLHDLIMEDRITPKDALDIFELIFHELFHRISEDNVDEDLLEKELSILIKTAQSLEIPEILIIELKKQIDLNKSKLIDKPILTSRDITPKNILLSPENKIMIVDFDLSQKTHFRWIDVWRSDFYTKEISLMNLKGKYSPKDVSDYLCDLLFYLNEVALAQKVLNQNEYKKTKEVFKLQVLTYFKTWLENSPGTSELAGLIELTNNNSNNNQKPLSHYYMQVFWSINNIFTENDSEKILINNNCPMSQTYSVKLPAGYRFIRIDPINSKGIVKIKSIRLFTQADLLYEVNTENNSLISGEVNIIVLSKDETVNYLCKTDDPQILLSLDREHENNIELLIEMSIDLDSVEALVDEFKKIQEKKKKISEVLSKITHQYEEIVIEKNELDKNFSALKGEYKTIKEELLTREEQLILRDATIDNLSKQNKLFLEDLVQMQKNVQDKEIEIKSLYNSKYWRLTSPLRKIVSIAKKVIEKFLNLSHILLKKKFPLNLGVNSGVIGSPFGWTSINSDPYFMLEGKFPVGWVKIRWTSCAKENISLKLYWDEGLGMSEKNSVIVGVIKKGELHSQEVLTFISPLAKSLRLDPGEIETEFVLEKIDVYKASKFHVMWCSIVYYIKQHGMSFNTFDKMVKKLRFIYKNQGFKGVWHKLKSLVNQSEVKQQLADYSTWVVANELTDEKISQIIEEIKYFKYKPLISILVPVYNVDEEWLVKCIESVRDQLYSNWELCIADDASPRHHVKKILEYYSNLDSRIKVVYRTQNGHISEASNSALGIVTGEFVALLDHDDELAIDALFENVKLLNTHPDADMIYSDEDKISIEGERHSPFFKPDWSPDTFLSQMYTCHLGVYRTRLLREIGGFRKGYEGSQDYDVVLRLTEYTDKIYHIAKVLYHWRAIPQSTASGGEAKDYTKNAGYKALVDTVKRRGINGYVEMSDIPNVYIVHYEPVGNPKVSILIPTRNMGDLLNRCLKSIFEKTSYRNYEIIVIDNGTNEQATIDVFDFWKQNEPDRFKVLRLDIPFNYSKLNNEGVKVVHGELVLLLNNDIEVITPNWLEEMVGQAIRSEIGAVGANLLYPDDTIQHAGIILGIGGIAGHSHKYYSINDYGYFSRLRMVTNYSAVTAACLMLRKEVYDSVGGLDEDLTVAFNDVDFCLRIREKGYRIVWLPHVQLYHHESKSRGQEDTLEKQLRFKKEIEFMEARWGRKLLTDPYYNSNLTLEHEDFSLKKI